MITAKRNETISKKEFIEERLAETLREANLNVDRLELSDNEHYVQIVFKDGYAKTVDIECDSFGGIILDVTRKALY